MDLAEGVPGAEQAPQLGAARLVEALFGQSQQLAAAIERVTLASPVVQRLVLGPPAGGVHAAGAHGHHVEGVGHGGGVGKMMAQRGPEGLVQVTDRDAHGVPPLLGSLGQPSVQVRGLAALDQVDGTAGLDVADARHPAGSLGGGGGQERGLVHADGPGRDHPVVILDQGGAPEAEGVHHGVPGHAQLLGRPGQGLDAAADLGRGPQPGTAGHRGSGRGDVGSVLSPGPCAAVRLDTAPAALEPHQGHRRAEGGEIGQGHPVPVLGPRPGPAGQTADQAIRRLDGDDEAFALSDHVEHLDSLQADQQLAPARTDAPMDVKGLPGRNLPGWR